MGIRIVTVLISALLLAGCSAGSVTIQGHDNAKTSLTGSVPANGQLQLSEGAACPQVSPSPGSPLPPIPAPPPLMAHQVCDPDGTNCKAMLMVSAAVITPTCYTQTVTSRGTDPTTWFNMGTLAALGIFAMSLLAS